MEMALWGCLLALLLTVMPTRQTAVSNPYNYWVTRTTSSFEDARAACVSSGGILAAIPSIEIQTFIEGYLNAQDVTESLWLGYLKTSSQWDDGTPFLWENYKDGEPNLQSEMCIGIFTSGQWSGQWFDLPCEDSQYADRGLCQGSVKESTFRLIPQGSIKTGNIIGDPILIRSRIECANHCMRISSDCVFFRYERMPKLCSLYGQGAGQVTIDTDKEWYTM